MTTITMICSRCGGAMATTTPDVPFDLFDCTWVCGHCGADWHPDDGWEEITNVVIPWRASDKGKPYAGTGIPPCPFCGFPAVFEHDAWDTETGEGGDGMGWMKCTNRGCGVKFYDDYANALKKWVNRA